MQAVRVHDIRVGAGGPERADRRRIAAPGDRHEEGARAGEVVLPLQLGGGADGDAHTPGDQACRERSDMRAAARTAAAQDVDRTQL